jgi:hypothetical protein
MVKFTFAAILAASIVAPALGAAISIDRLESRDVVANTDSELFGRAVAEVFNDLYSREELSELMERDIEEFTTRDLAELMEREFDVEESLITRDLLEASELDARSPLFRRIKKMLGFGANAASAAPPPEARDFEEDFEAREYEDDVFEARDSMDDLELEARTPIFGWIKKKLGFGSSAAPAPEQTARDFEDDFEARDSMADRDLEVRAPIFGWIKKKLGFGSSAAPAPEQTARDFDEDTLDARADAPAPAPRQPNIIEKFMNLFRNKNHPGAKKAAAAKKAGGKAPAPAAPAPAAPAPEAPAAEAPAARDFFDEDLLERDYDEDIFERAYYDEEIFEREFDEDVFERDFEDVFERDYEVDELD